MRLGLTAVAMLVAACTNVAHAGWIWSSIDYPDPNLETWAGGIEGNFVVGICYSDPNHDQVESVPTNGHPFTYDGTTYTAIENYPGSFSTQLSIPYGRKIEGSYTVWNSEDSNYYTTHGCIYDLDDSNWITYDVSGADNTSCNGMHGNYIVGNYDIDNVWYSFLWDYEANCLWTIDPGLFPNYLGSEACGVWGSIVVGAYADMTGKLYGYIYHLDSNTCTTFSYPEARLTEPTDIEGDYIVGVYAYGDPEYFGDPNFFEGHGFIYNRVTEEWTTLDYPGAIWTQAYSISGNKIVGVYWEPNGHNHGFLLTLPKLSLAVINGENGTVTVEPNQPFYTNANTVVTLTATAVEGQGFYGWAVYDSNHPYDPNHQGDANYAAFVDANSTLRLTMSDSYEVRAYFTCGSGLMEMFALLGAGLLAVPGLRRRVAA